MKPRIAITMGDAAGVGPEICLAVLQEASILSLCHPVIFGDLEVLQVVAKKCNRTLPEDIQIFESIESLPSAVQALNGSAIFDVKKLGQSDAEPGKVSAQTGAASFGYIESAIEAALTGAIDAVVTGPINKEAWNAANVSYPGHTELFAERANTQRFCMMMTAPSFSVSMVTTHVGYREVPSLLTTDRILEVIQMTHQSLKKIYGREPKLTTLGLNPHAGEDGLFGEKEEEQIILPAVELARGQGIEITDPLPPDTAFVPAWRKKTDGYICMYHDQALIPFKAFNFDTGVNITLGLPNLIRTSVDHGTALDIAWQGVADSSSLQAAIRLAVQLVDP